MTVTEVALLHLTPDNSIDDTSIRGKLSNAKTVMQNYTGRTFYLMQQIEDPLCLYIIGEWDSLDQHIDHFIPSAENQALLESLKGQVNVDWLLHLDVSHADLPVPKSAVEKEKARRGEVVWSVVRYFIKEGGREDFQQCFDANKHLLQDFVTEGKVGGGWRVDGEGEVEGQVERVSLCPWKAVEQHREFAETEEFKKYGRIREHIEGAEIKHAKLLDL